VPRLPQLAPVGCSLAAAGQQLAALVQQQLPLPLLLLLAVTRLLLCWLAGAVQCAAGC
jgi:hypothetical protein